MSADKEKTKQEILNNWIYPKQMKKYCYHEGEFTPGFPKDKLEDMIVNEIESGDPIIWIRNQALISKKSKFWFEDNPKTTDLEVFAKNIDKLKHECILISSYGARPVPSSVKDETFETIINCPYIKKWFTQNYDGTIIHPKLFPYPIGFPAVRQWWVKHNKNTTIDTMIDYRKINNIKENKVFCDVHILGRPGVGKERLNVKKEIVNANCDHLVILKERTQNMEEVYNLYSKYKFVVCTHGLGLDCHRTWEVFMVGGIVITKHSAMDYLYDDLPVIYVDEWKEVLDKDNLSKWEKKVGHLTTEENIYPKLKRRYWIEEKIYNFNVSENIKE